MAYILKGVCKDWKLLVERTPALWQKVLLDYNVGGEHTSFRSLEHCREMMQHVLLPRCAGLPLEINIRQLSKSHIGGDRSRPGQFEQLYNAHMEYIEPMVGLLAEHGSRWSSLAFEACQDLADMNLNIHLEQFLHTLSSSKFNNLDSLTIRSSTCPPRLNLSKSAPHLHKLVMLREWRPNLQKFQDSLNLQWSSVTTLVMDLYITHPKALYRVHAIAEVLNLVRHNLKHHVWTGKWDSPYPAAEQMLSRIFGGPHLELRNLRSLVLGGDRSSFHFSTTFLPHFLCHKLEKLHLLWCVEAKRRDERYSYMGWERPLRVPIEAVAPLLQSSPNLREVAILFTPFLWFRGALQGPFFSCMKREMRGYLTFKGSRNALHLQVAERLAKDARMSSRLSLVDLTRHSPYLVKEMLSKILPLVPYYTYSSQRKDHPGEIYPIPHLAETPFEKRLRCMTDGPGKTDWSPVLERAFSFIDVISRSAESPGTIYSYAARDHAWKALNTDDLYNLAEIVDMVRDQPSYASSGSEPASYVREPDMTESTCNFTLAVAV